jgi:uncharacterized protein (DUF488 family)
METSKLFTIGHSTDSLDRFLLNLAEFNIKTVVDIRSVPYSRYVSHFNKESLSAFLKKNGVFYIYMGDSLGARYNDPNLLFEDGIVDFAKVKATSNFLSGLYRIESGVAKGYKVAIMCSEKNPLECHRFSLVAAALHERGHKIGHIVNRGLFFHKSLEDSLLNYYQEHKKIVTDLKRVVGFRLVQPQLFDDSAIDVAELYLMLNKLVGYSASEVIKKAV